MKPSARTHRGLAFVTAAPPQRRGASHQSGLQSRCAPPPRELLPGDGSAQGPRHGAARLLRAHLCGGERGPHAGQLAALLPQQEVRRWLHGGSSSMARRHVRATATPLRSRIMMRCCCCCPCAQPGGGVLRLQHAPPVRGGRQHPRADHRCDDAGCALRRAHRRCRTLKKAPPLLRLPRPSRGAQALCRLPRPCATPARTSRTCASTSASRLPRPSASTSSSRQPTRRASPSSNNRKRGTATTTQQ